jgi:dienelactone hydrolase
MDAYLDFQFTVPIYGMQGPSHARALVSVPLGRRRLPVVVLLEGRAHLYDHDSSGRQLFDDGIADFVLLTPKADADDALLSRTNSREDWRFAEDALWRLVTEGLFEVDRRLEAGTVDFSRIYCTGYSLGGDSCFGLAALPGVGRLLAGLVPFACRGEESLVYTRPR